jgi:hypothetical protein
MATPGSGLGRRAGAAAILLALVSLAACQSLGPPMPKPPLRERNYDCQTLGPGDTQEDEALCEYNKHPSDM